MDEQRLLDGIIKQAEEDSNKILERANEAVIEKNNALDARQARMTAETDIKIQKKMLEIEKQTESAVISEKRRKKLKKREEINAEVISRFYSKIENLIGTDEYNDFSAKLIAEGIIAVNEDEVEVSCSHREELNQAVLNKAADYVKTLTGRTVSISLNSENRISAQGITIGSKDGRINFSNRISSRLRRFDEDIKQLIFAELNKE